MRVVLVGADFEENLGIGMIAAVAEQAGHAVEIVPFDLPEDAPRVAARILGARPDVVGLGIQFQHRASEFLSLSRDLRQRGFAGHITCGGQFPTLAWREVLEHPNGLDSVVLHEGERAFVGLLSALDARTRLAEVPGLAIVADDGAALRTPALPLLERLDELPYPVRYRAHAKHCGIPFIPVMGSRGCWGACTYCSITSFYRDARAHGGGKTLRQRTPENLAAEMAVLWHDAGGPSIFCFHDDNFLMPRAADSAARVRAIRASLDEFGVGKVGFIGKCRPDSVTPELMKELRELGVFRLYVGVENASQHGSDHLNRRTQTLRVRDALRACREAGIFVCYNILLFEPEATLDDVRENIAFMREHARHPVNFCRAEPYYGTPLQLSLVGRENAGGSYLGYNYRIADDRTELLFRVCASAFRQRNFDPAGVANRNMGVGYSIKVLEHFYDDPDGKRAGLERRASELTRRISNETASFLEQALELVERVGTRNSDRIERETALLGLRIAAADRERHLELDALYADMEAFGARTLRSRVLEGATRKLKQAAQSVALTASLAIWASACNACGAATTTVDPVPGDNNPNNNPPPDPVPNQLVVPNDPVPNTVDFQPIPPSDPVPNDQVMVPDPPPPPLDQRMMPMDPVPAQLTPAQQRQQQRQRQRQLQLQRNHPPPPDPVPSDLILEDPAPRPFPPPVMDPVPRATSSLQLLDQWRDTTTRLATRTDDLALSNPPWIALRATREGEVVRVTVVGGPAALSLRWETDGEVDGAGREVRWKPASPVDQLRVAVRSATGVSITSLRAREV
jgi:radical SAM superfamily enzyme YgiQ (UPF0313 family)